MSWYQFRPYVSVAQRRLNARREVAKLGKKGKAIHPVQIEGRTIARTFWGKAWCDNLESYMDYANRLPRGRTYVRNGSVVHLDIRAGQIEALVSGSELYKVRIQIQPAANASDLAANALTAGPELAESEISAVFGIELDSQTVPTRVGAPATSPPAAAVSPAPPAKRKRPLRRKSPGRLGPRAKKRITELAKAHRRQAKEM